MNALVMKRKKHYYIEGGLVDARLLENCYESFGNEIRMRVNKPCVTCIECIVLHKIKISKAGPLL